jgi:hypothetical protein
MRRTGLITRLGFEGNRVRNQFWSGHCVLTAPYLLDVEPVDQVGLGRTVEGRVWSAAGKRVTLSKYESPHVVSYMCCTLPGGNLPVRPSTLQVWKDLQKSDPSGDPSEGVSDPSDFWPQIFPQGFGWSYYLLLKLLPLSVAADQERLRDDMRCILVSLVHALPHRLQSVG